MDSTKAKLLTLIFGNRIRSSPDNQQDDHHMTIGSSQRRAKILKEDYCARVNRGRLNKRLSASALVGRSSFNDELDVFERNAGNRRSADVVCRTVCEIATTGVEDSTGLVMAAEAGVRGDRGVPEGRLVMEEQEQERCRETFQRGSAGDNDVLRRRIISSATKTRRKAAVSCLIEGELTRTAAGDWVRYDCGEEEAADVRDGYPLRTLSRSPRCHGRQMTPSVASTDNLKPDRSDNRIMRHIDRLTADRLNAAAIDGDVFQATANKFLSSDLVKTQERINNVRIMRQISESQNIVIPIGGYGWSQSRQLQNDIASCLVSVIPDDKTSIYQDKHSEKSPQNSQDSGFYQTGGHEKTGNSRHDVTPDAANSLHNDVSVDNTCRLIRTLSQAECNNNLKDAEINNHLHRNARHESNDKNTSGCVSEWSLSVLSTSSDESDDGKRVVRKTRSQLDLIRRRSMLLDRKEADSLRCLTTLARDSLTAVKMTSSFESKAFVMDNSVSPSCNDILWKNTSSCSAKEEVLTLQSSTARSKPVHRFRSASRTNAPCKPVLSVAPKYVRNTVVSYTVPKTRLPGLESATQRGKILSPTGSELQTNVRAVDINDETCGAIIEGFRKVLDGKNCSGNTNRVRRSFRDERLKSPPPAVPEWGSVREGPGSRQNHRAPHAVAASASAASCSRVVSTSDGRRRHRSLVYHPTRASATPCRYSSFNSGRAPPRLRTVMQHPHTRINDNVISCAFSDDCENDGRLNDVQLSSTVQATQLLRQHPMASQEKGVTTSTKADDLVTSQPPATPLTVTSSWLGVTSRGEALRLAARSGLVALVHELLADGAAIDRDKDGCTALHYAAGNGHLEVVEVLLGRGCQTEIKDKSSQTALHRASAAGHAVTVKILLDAGAQVNRQDAEGNTALHKAAWNGYSRTVQQLVQHAASTALCNKTGCSALHLAVQNGHNQCARVLLFAGCSPNLKNEFGDTALHTAARYGHAGVTRILASARCQLDQRNKNGDSPLHIAVAFRRKKITAILIEYGINCSCRNKQGERAEDIAASKEYTDILQLISAKAVAGSKRRNVCGREGGRLTSSTDVTTPSPSGDQQTTLTEEKKKSRLAQFFSRRKKGKDISIVSTAPAMEVPNTRLSHSQSVTNRSEQCQLSKDRFQPTQCETYDLAAENLPPIPSSTEKTLCLESDKKLISQSEVRKPGMASREYDDDLLYQWSPVLPLPNPDRLALGLTATAEDNEDDGPVNWNYSNNVFATADADDIDYYGNITHAFRMARETKAGFFRPGRSDALSSTKKISLNGSHKEAWSYFVPAHSTSIQSIDDALLLATAARTPTADDNYENRFASYAEVYRVPAPPTLLPLPNQVRETVAQPRGLSGRQRNAEAHDAVAREMHRTLEDESREYVRDERHSQSSSSLEFIGCTASIYKSRSDDTLSFNSSQHAGRRRHDTQRNDVRERREAAARALGSGAGERRYRDRKDEERRRRGRIDEAAGGGAVGDSATVSRKDSNYGMRLRHLVQIEPIPLSFRSRTSLHEIKPFEE